MTKQPLVSVVIPVYNEEKYVRHSLESILSQSYSNLEIIVINDGSTDKTSSILNDLYENDSRLKLFNQKNQGLVYSLNKGLRKANGEFIARMDADDWSYPERIEEQVNFLQRNIDYVAIGTCAEVIDRNGEYIYLHQSPADWEEIKRRLPKIPFIHPSVMFRREEALEVGGYPNVPMGEDLFFFNILAQKGKFKNLQKALIKYRMLPNSYSRTSSQTKKLVYKLLDVYLNKKILDKNILEELKNSIDSNLDNKSYNYHILLGKKYLWDNYSGNQSRFHFRKAVANAKQISLYFEPFLLYMISFLGKNNVYKLYKFFGGN